VAATEPAGASPSPEAVAIDQAEARTLLGALDRLPDRDRLVVAARYLFELSEAETAEVLGVPAGTVKSRLSRAMTRLRTELASEASTGVDGA
jgi:RNA polymerase sigma factor (sigma-70 family)